MIFILYIYLLYIFIYLFIIYMNSTLILIIILVLIISYDSIVKIQEEQLSMNKTKETNKKKLKKCFEKKPIDFYEKIIPNIKPNLNCGSLVNIHPSQYSLHKTDNHNWLFGKSDYRLQTNVRAGH